MLRRTIPTNRRGVPTLPWTPAQLSASELLIWAEPETFADLAATSAGTGAVVSGDAVGWVRDRSLNGNHLVQATSGRRPVAKSHALGRGIALFGTGGVGAGGAFLASGSSLSTAKYLWLVATILGPDTTRGGSAAPSNLFADDYHGFAGTAPISASAVLATGFSGLNNWGQYSLTSYRRDGASVSVAAADAGLGRRVGVYRFEHTTTADAGLFNLLRHVGYDGYYARGAVLAALVGSSSLSAAKVALVDSYLESRYLSGRLVVVTGDSLAAGYGLTETQGPSALLHEGYSRCVPCPTIAVPGQGIGSSISPLVDTLLTTDAAKLATLKFSRSPAVLVVICGTNDLANSRTAAQLLADLQTYCAARRASGWKVVVSTIAPRTKDTDGITAWPAGKESERTSYNTSVRSGWAAFADGLVDVDTVAPGLAADGIHWTVAGTSAVATAVKAVTDSLL